MRLIIQHRTLYRYSLPVSYGLQQLRLTPRSGPGQRVLDWSVTVEGGTEEVAFDDQHMNRVMLVSFSGEGHEIVVTCKGEVETVETHGVTGRHQGHVPLWLYGRPTELTRAGAGVRRLARGLAQDGTDLLARLHALAARVTEAIAYTPGATRADTPAEAALDLGQGVCQDHANVFIAAARSGGVPARYVSGYLMMPDRTLQDAGHAWAEAHVEGLGWVGFDAANGISPDERYVRLAVGLDSREAAPVLGLRYGTLGDESLAVAIQVQQ